MFTGIVEAVGTLTSTVIGRLSVATQVIEEPWQIGESVAINGCCLTVVGINSDRLDFDLSEETLKRTTLGVLTLGSKVNIERAVRMGDRLGGHLVQGHVDAVGTITQINQLQGSTWFHFETQDSRFVIDKGSVAVDGISLTAVSPTATSFSVAVIPHTLAQTNLQFSRTGDSVNIEFDMLGKYVERLLGSK